MKKGVIIGLVIAAILVLVTGAYILRNIYAPTSGTPQNVTSDEINNLFEPENLVVLSGFKFNPATMNIAIGETVTWKNEDSAAHTVTSDSGNELDSPLFGQGETYAHVFTVAGNYTYHCAPHTSMKGTVVVS